MKSYHANRRCGRFSTRSMCAAFLGLALASCSDDSPECVIDSDCLGVCVNNICVANQDASVPDARADSGPITQDASLPDATAPDASVDAAVDAGPRIRATEWTQTFGSASASAGQEHARAMAHTSTGDIVIAGPFSGSLTVGTTTLVSEGETDVFAIRMTAGGTPIWAMSFGSTASDTCRGVAVDADDNIYVTGQHRGVVSGGVALTHIDAQDLFVAKLSPDGTPLWAQAYGGTGLDTGNSLAVSQDHVFIVGAFTDDITLGEDRFESEAEQRSGFVMDLSREGVLRWAHVFQASGASVQALGAAALDNEKVYVAGIFGGSVDFGGIGVRSPTGPQDAFVMKINGEGVSTQFAQFGGDDVVLGRAVATAPGRGVVLVGRFLGTATFGGGERTSAGGQDAYVVRLGPDLTPMWDAVIGGAGADRALGVDTHGESVLVAGQFHQSMTLDGTTLTSAGNSDVYGVEFNELGEVVWAERFGGTEDDWGYAALINDEHLVVSGYYEGTTDFGEASAEGDVVVRSTSR